MFTSINSRSASELRAARAAEAPPLVIRSGALRHAPATGFPPQLRAKFLLFSEGSMLKDMGKSPSKVPKPFPGTLHTLKLPTLYHEADRS